MVRPLRVCDVCNQADDHPRHVQGRPGLPALTRHMDCCASEGCEVCAGTEKANKGLRGQKLIDHLNATRGKN